MLLDRKIVRGRQDDYVFSLYQDDKTQVYSIWIGYLIDITINKRPHLGIDHWPLDFFGTIEAARIGWYKLLPKESL